MPNERIPTAMLCPSGLGLELHHSQLKKKKSVLNTLWKSNSPPADHYSMNIKFYNLVKWVILSKSTGTWKKRLNGWHFIFCINIQAIIIWIYLTIDFHHKAERKKRKENIFYDLYSGHHLYISLFFVVQLHPWDMLCRIGRKTETFAYVRSLLGNSKKPPTTTLVGTQCGECIYVTSEEEPGSFNPAFFMQSGNQNCQQKWRSCARDMQEIAT